MSTSTSKVRVPTRSNGILLAVRLVILTLDFTTIIALAVSIGLYHRWIPSTSYPTTALQPNSHTDWTDLIVFSAVLVSFMWTIFITLRPSWTRETLHQGYHVFFEFVCLAWLLGCSIPAFKFRESNFKNLVAISNTCDMGDVTLMNGEKVPWVCMPHLHTLKKLQTVTYSLACAIAVIHFTLLAFACLSTLRRSQDPTQKVTAAQHMEKHPDQERSSHDTQASNTTTTTRMSESDSLPPHPPTPPRVEVAEY